MIYITSKMNVSTAILFHKVYLKPGLSSSV